MDWDWETEEQSDWETEEEDGQTYQETDWEEDWETGWEDDWQAELYEWDMDRYLRTAEEYYGSGIGPPTGRIESAICHSPGVEEVWVENGLIYDSRGNLIGELPLEEPNFFFDPINYLGGLGGFFMKGRYLYPRSHGTGNTDFIIKWPKGYKTRFDITKPKPHKWPHIHPWTKK